MGIAPAVFPIGFIVILIGAILAVGSGIIGFLERSRKQFARFGVFKKLIALLGGILMCLSMIIFIIWLEVEWSLFSGRTINILGDQIYYKYTIGFGFFGPIIGGSICIATIFLDRDPNLVTNSTRNTQTA
ncbi:MAG: hypothetical protein ACFFG0_36705 [Candidatus Thorarchaeota archaeon]